jgi:hypothetical protein
MKFKLGINESISNFFKLSAYSKKYSRLDRLPKKIHLFPLSLAISKHYKTGLSSFLRFVKVNQLSSEMIPKNDFLPSITLLIIVAKKDFRTLPVAIKQIIKHSLNPISRLEVITPASEVSECQKIVEGINLKIQFTVSSENDYFSDDIRKYMKVTFGRKYGWALQQFLTVKYVLNSLDLGILALNSDTIILQDQVWLNDDLVQILYQSSELHRPYYKILGRLFPKLDMKMLSHITHHMLFQPELLRIIFERNDIQDTEQLIKSVGEVFDRKQESPFCVEFEPYAQGLHTYFPDRFLLRRFSNASFPTKKDQDKLWNLISHYDSMGIYNSISLHSWNI